MVQPGRSAVKRFNTWFWKSWAFIVVCWPIADVTSSSWQACIPSLGCRMPFSRWRLGGRPGLKDRVVNALQEARDGDTDAAIDTIAERFSEALAELRSLRQPVDSGWLRLAARLAYR